MILTCPDCATSYFVDDARIPPEGRVVKCSSCGNRWRAAREAPEAGPAQPAAEIIPQASPEPVAEEAPAEPAQTPSAEDLEIIAEPAPVRRPRPARNPKPRLAGAAVAWTAIAAGIAVVVGVVAFRAQIVRIAPATAAAFAAVGLPVDRLGLTIGDVRSVATLQAGRPVLSITGAIRNTRGETVTSPALRISLLDRDGKAVAARIARPLNAEVPPGATRYFAIAIPDPPAGSASLDIVFEPAAAEAAPAEPAVEAHMGAEPMEAKPLNEGHGTAADHG